MIDSCAVEWSNEIKTTCNSQLGRYPLFCAPNPIAPVAGAFFAMPSLGTNQVYMFIINIIIIMLYFNIYTQWGMMVTFWSLMLITFQKPLVAYYWMGLCKDEDEL